MALVDPIDLSQFDLTPEPATFGPLWAQYFSEVDGLDTQDLIDAGAVTLGDIAPILSAIDTPLGMAASSLEGELGLPADAELPRAEASGAVVDKSFDSVLKSMPPEAFQPLPEDLRPPVDLGGFTSSGPGGAPSPTPGPTPAPVGPGQPPITIPGPPNQPQPYWSSPEVQLANTTRIGALDFKSGETFELQILGKPDSPVVVGATHLGASEPNTGIGSTDSTGYFVLAGTFTDEDKGEWFESWYVAGILASPVLHFFVN